MDPVTIANEATLIYDNITKNSKAVVTRILSLYDLTATKEALLDSYTPGQTITYITRVENTGSASLYNLTIVDDLANGTLQYIDTSIEGYLNGSPIEVDVQKTANTVTFKIDNVLNPNDNVLIIFETTTPTTNPEQITNTQTITANGGSTTGPIVTAKPNPSATVTLANYVTLDITKAVDKTSIYSGESLVYTFKIVNRGNETATNVTFNDIFPTGYKINSIILKTPDSPDPIIYDPGTYVQLTTLKIDNLVIPVGTSTLTVTGIYTS